MRNLVILLTAVAIVFAGLVVSSYRITQTSSGHSPPALTSDQPVGVATLTTDSALLFISTCSGLDVSTPSRMSMAYINCIGRVRGFIDGHMMTVELQHAIVRNQLSITKITPLWCIPPDITDGDLLIGIIEWTNTNEKATKALTTKFPGNTGSLAIITRALHDQYVCDQHKIS